MRSQLPRGLLTSLVVTLLAAVAASTTTTKTTKTSITLHIPPTHILPNPRALPPSTHATLSALHADASAFLTPANTFVFHNVTEGSYLLDVHCATHAFAPLRVDVLPVQAGAAPTGVSGVSGQGGEQVAGLKVSAWETYRGNDWENKGEAAAAAAVVVAGGKALEVKVLGAKGFFVERSSFNILSIFKNPMILLGLVSMVIFLGMPYLVDNMDPEMRKEFVESQKSNPMSSLLGGQSGGQGNFDMASFLAGSSSNNNGGGGSGGAKNQKGARK